MDLHKTLGRKLKILGFIFITIVATSNYVNAEDEIWTPETTLKVKSVSNVDVSSNGKEVIYTVTEARVEGELNEYITQIWKGKVDDLNTHTQFTTGKQSSTFPRWSPNGRWIAFLSKRSGVNNLYLISPDGGEAVQITEVTDGVETFRWSPVIV